MPLIIPANTLSTGGYEVANSCRFNDDDSAYMHKTPAGAGNLRTFTISLWIKRGALGTRKALFNNTDGDGQEGVYYDFQADDTLLISDYGTGSYDWNLETTQVFRDPSAWYHIVIAVDTEQAVAANRVKLYVNGSQITAFDTENYPSEDADTLWNTTDRFEIGSYNGTGNFFDGYLAEVVHIDGSQLAPTSFGEFDEDSPTIWKPKDVSGLTFGTNGFYLDFEDSAALGDDKSGNSNDFTVNNLAATDQATDTPTNNFATLNPLLGPRYSTQTYSEGNTAVSGGAGFEFHPSTIGMTTGKWYFEAKCTTLTSYPGVGIITSHQFETNNQDAQSNSQGYVMHYNGQFNNGGSVVYTGTTLSVNDILMIAFDAGNGRLWFGLNGTWENSATQGEIEAGTTTNAIWSNVTNAGTDSYHFLVQNYDSAWSANFGNPSFSITSGNADADGYGNFEYAVPSGFYALCTKNLAEYG